MIKIQVEPTKALPYNRAIMYNGKPLSDCPASYEKVGLIGHSIGNNYNPSYMTVYKTRSGYAYEIYRDGCFYPYYGKISFYNV